MGRKKINLQDVRRSFDGSRDANMPRSAVYFGRPLADIVTPLFFNSGWTANGVTLLRILLSVVALVSIGTGVQLLMFAGAILAIVAFVLDFVDGHIARLDDSASYWGKFTDGLGDYIFPAGGPLAAGCGLWMQGGNGWFMLAGASVTVVVLAVRVARDRLRYFELWMVVQSGPMEDERKAAASVWLRRQGWMAAFTADARTTALLLLFIPDGGLSFCLTLLVIQAPTELLWLLYILGGGRVLLDRWRRSAHAVS